MGKELDSHVRRAGELYRQAYLGGLTSGCFEVALTALGANIHFQDMEDMTSWFPDPGNYMERFGMETEIYYELTDRVTYEDIQSIIGDQYTRIPNYTLLGYLSFTLDPKSGSGHHVCAILPRPQLPRDSRRYANHTDSQCIVDAAHDPILRFVSVWNMVDKANTDINQGKILFMHKVICRKNNHRIGNNS